MTYGIFDTRVNKVASDDKGYLHTYETKSIADAECMKLNLCTDVVLFNNQPVYVVKPM